jgi:hypothetical protein
MLNIVRQTIYCTFLLSFFFPVAGTAQCKSRIYSRQLSVTSENDRYLFQGKDGYYTNGLLLNYTKALPIKNGRKRLNSFELGQKMFLPYSRKIFLPSQIDRPVTGYLYFRFTRMLAASPNELWQWGASVDAIGDASLARSVQNTFHNWININSGMWGWVWNYQLKSSVGANLHGTFAKGLIKQDAASLFQVVPVTTATIGTSFTNISQGVILQVGSLRPLQRSAFWNAAVQATDEAAHTKSEWFIYYYPNLHYQVFNSTVQGSLLRRDRGPITSAAEPFVWTHQAGVLFSADRYYVKLAANVQTKEARSQQSSQRYGSVQVGYRMK